MYCGVCQHRFLTVMKLACLLNPVISEVAAGRGAKHPYQITSGNKVLACTNAPGCAILPMVIFGHRAQKPELTIGEVPGTFYGLSDSG